MTQGVLLYVALCVPNEKLYFGITGGTLRSRIQRHLSGARNPKTRFHRALRKYGAAGFVWYEIGRLSTKDEAGELERACIQYFKTQDPFRGYNTQAGGQVGPGAMPEETRTKLRARRHSEATKARMSEARRGQVAWSKGLKLTPEQIRPRLGNQNRRGKSATPEACARMSLAQKGNQNARGRGTPRETILAALGEVPALGVAATARKYGVDEATVRWWRKRHTP